MIMAKDNKEQFIRTHTDGINKLNNLNKEKEPKNKNKKR